MEKLLKKTHVLFYLEWARYE